MRWLGLLGLSSALLQAAEFPQTIETQAGPVVVSVAATGLQVPWAMAFLPDGRALITERAGTLKRWDPSSGALEEILGVPKVFASGQGGLLDVQLHPDFKTNQRVYLCYAQTDGANHTTALGYATLNGNRLEGFKRVFQARPSFNTALHFGCRMQFNAERQIFFSIGERNQRDLAQDLRTHMGKLLRLSDEGIAIANNPFAKRKDALPEIFSFGHRNPQGLAIHPTSGLPWLTEHGPRGGDEINQPQAARNYGWPVITFGREYYGPKIGEGSAKEGMQAPLHQWTPSIGPSSLLIYSGAAHPGWRGDFFTGALALTHLNRITFKDGLVSNQEQLFDDFNWRIREVEQDAQGNLFLLIESGWLVKIAPARPSSQSGLRKT